MGLCGSSQSADYKAAAERSKKLEDINKKTWAAERQKIKLLLLGAGESGKSTIFKQMKIIYGNNFPLEERQQAVTVVHSNILGNVRSLLAAAKKLDVPLADGSLHDEFGKIPDSEEVVMDAAMGALLKRIWADAGAQTTWTRRSEYHIQDSLAWYMDNVDRISAEGYVPSVEDILRARVRTSGIVEETFKVDGVDFEMYDVGGQRNERKKWIHLFDAVTAVIFVAALSEYDQFLYEDDQMYRMDEAVLLFDEVCNLKHFRQTSMILFLNKVDLFREKLKTVPVRVVDGPHKRYEDFKGPFVRIGTSEAEFGDPSFELAFEAARDFFLQLFLRRNQQPQKEVYSHITCATDTSNVKVVFHACKDIILKGNLRGSGFMGSFFPFHLLLLPRCCRVELTRVRAKIDAPRLPRAKRWRVLMMMMGSWWTVGRERVHGCCAGVAVVVVVVGCCRGALRYPKCGTSFFSLRPHEPRVL